MKLANKQNNINCAVFSVIYPDAEPYIHEFVNSLSKQSDKDFTLFLINDGFSNLERFIKTVDYEVRVADKVGFPAELRKEGINWVISEGAEIIIFADADDYFEDNRIEVSKKILKDYDIVFNELFLVGDEISEPISMLNAIFTEKEEIRAKHIINGNCMGLSNTAVRTNIIPSSMRLILDDIIAFDWALFAICVYAGARTVFTQETKTYYRQHGGNTVSPHCLSEKQIMRGVKVKKDHYKLLSRFYEEYISLSDLFRDLLTQLLNNKVLRQKYCEAVKTHTSNISLWWEPIKTKEELGL